MLRKTIYLLLFWVAFIPIGSAQTITWLVQPKYDSISYLNESVFKCKLGKQVQLVNAKGRELLVPAADSVTNYCENRALILDKKGDKFIIRSIIDESGLLTKVNGDYYTNNYSYFSGGFVSVVGQSGKAGYLDVNGNLAIPCQYRIARPFIQGWASVEPAKRKQQTLYIDSKGNLLKIRGFHDGKVVMGSSFNSLGEALVTYYDNDNAVINTKGEVVREYVRKENVIPIRTYDFSFDESGKNTIPVFSVEISFDTEPTPFLSGQLLGYKKADHFVALPQFSKAEKFADGSAIVCHNGKHGIVKLLEGSFSGEFVGEDLIVSPGKQASSYTYNLVVPESMKSESLQVKFDVGDGNMQTVSLTNGKYDFTPVVGDASVCRMRMEVLSDGLLLWADSIEKKVTNASLEISAPVTISERANEQDELRISSIITNNSDSEVIVSGAFSAKFADGSNNRFGNKKSFWYKMAPNSQREVFADLIVVEEETVKMYISVTVNQKPYGTKSTVMQLKPFY